MLSSMTYSIRHPHNSQQNMCYQDLSSEEFFLLLHKKRGFLDTFLLGSYLPKLLHACLPPLALKLKSYKLPAEKMYINKNQSLKKPNQF